MPQPPGAPGRRGRALRGARRRAPRWRSPAAGTPSGSGRCVRPAPGSECRCRSSRPAAAAVVAACVHGADPGLGQDEAHLVRGAQCRPRVRRRRCGPARCRWRRGTSGRARRTSSRRRRGPARGARAPGARAARRCRRCGTRDRREARGRAWTPARRPGRAAARTAGTGRDGSRSPPPRRARPARRTGPASVAPITVTVSPSRADRGRREARDQLHGAGLDQPAQVGAEPAARRQRVGGATAVHARRVRAADRPDAPGSEARARRAGRGPAGWRRRSARSRRRASCGRRTGRGRRPRTSGSGPVTQVGRVGLADRRQTRGPERVRLPPRAGGVDDGPGPELGVDPGGVADAHQERTARAVEACARGQAPARDAAVTRCAEPDPVGDQRRGSGSR